MKHAADHPPFSADDSPLPPKTSPVRDHPEPAEPVQPSAPGSSAGPEPAAPQADWPRPVETGPGQVSYRIRVNAPAQQLWEQLANPHRHHEVDGSGTVKSQVNGPQRLEVGDQFSVHMRKYRIPYTMTLTTTGSQPGTLIEWSHPGGHRWRWEFQDHGDGTTDVTETFDYSWAKPAVGKAYELLKLPQENGRGIQASLTRLAGHHL